MDIYNKQFVLRQETPNYWINKSRDLCVSAFTLWNAMEKDTELEANCWATYKMLMGMSFELLFKAYCIASDTELNPTHDLVALANSARLSTSDDEKKILKLLSEYIIWDGRYPIPKKPEQLKAHWENQSKISANLLDFKSLLQLWRRFSDSFIEQYN